MIDNEYKDYISSINLKYGENGTYVEVQINDGHTRKFVYPHKSLFESIDSVKEDIIESISKVKLNEPPKKMYINTPNLYNFLEKKSTRKSNV